jgi:hypothetical protein
MAQAELVARVDARVKRAVERLCAARGLDVGRFVEEALIEKIEAVEDVTDLKAALEESRHSLAEMREDDPFDEP